MMKMTEGTRNGHPPYDAGGTDGFQGMSVGCEAREFRFKEVCGADGTYIPVHAEGHEDEVPAQESVPEGANDEIHPGQSSGQAFKRKRLQDAHEENEVSFIVQPNTLIDP